MATLHAVAEHGVGIGCRSDGRIFTSSGDWDSGNPAFAISRGSRDTPALTPESGRGQACPGPSHTTRHAGPHRAVRSAFPDTAVGFGESFQAHGLVPVGVR